MNVIPPSFKIGKLKQTTYMFCSSNLFDCKEKKPIQASEGKYYISISFKYPHQPLGLHLWSVKVALGTPSRVS